MLIKSKSIQLNNDFAINFDETQIRLSPAVKVFGVTVYSNITFEAQISSVIRRCYATMGGLAKLARSLSGQVKKMIIEALVFPQLSYCITVWAGITAKQKHRIEKVINHCAQIVKGMIRSDHVSPLLRSLRWPRVDQLVIERDLAFMHWLLFHEQASASLRERVLYRGQGMEWTGSVRWIHNPVQSRWIWIGLDQKFINSADCGLDWIDKSAMCIPSLEI